MKLVCGVDEAGRGPLAGPVYAAAVILGPGKSVMGIADSKMLSPERREVLAQEIRLRAVAWSVASASVEEIDTLNILQASLLAMRRAVEALQVAPERVLVDGLHCPRLSMPARAVVGGDGTVVVIGAASILAKVARDEEMRALHRLHPQYGFDQHKGYPTRDHLEALRAHGASAVHRHTFGPVRLVLGLRSTPE